MTDKHATKKNIIQALQHLIKQLKAGDDVCLHFSCHGQQMEDDNGDEADELDEALIPYDAQSTYQKGIYEGENHLRDDELEKFLISIRQKIGIDGSVLITFDACHSGTANRIEEYVEDDDAPYPWNQCYFFLQSFLYSTRQQTYRKENKTCTTKRFVSHLYHQCLPTFPT